MHQKTNSPKNTTSPVGQSKNVNPSDNTGEADAYAKVCRLLETGRVDEALTLARSRHDAPMKNAQGVCLMRKGLAEDAVRVYRPLVLDNTGLFMREQIPPVYKTNYALALLLSGHIAGGISILNEVAGEDDPSVERLRKLVADWKSKLSFFQRLGLIVGLEPKRPFELDSPPGELL